jgi:GT2 family glycosyltransferase
LSRVDVIVPCYNYGRFLDDCVSSILRQDGVDVRVLIIDDASTDGSRQVAQRIAAEDQRVSLILHDNNCGHIETYNEGIRWVSAEYLLLLSSDDVLACGALIRAIKLMEANPNIGFVHGTSVRFTEKDDILRATANGTTCADAAAPTVESRIAFIQKFCAKPVNTVETATAVVRTRFQKRVGGYRPELPHSGDMEMWLRLAAHADVGFVPAVQAFTRIHAENMHHTYKRNRDLEDFRQRRLVFQTFFDSAGRDLKERPELEPLAYRSLAEELLWGAARAFDEGASNRIIVQLIEEATAIWPSITSTALWWKVFTRRLFGPAIWPLIRAAGQLPKTIRA